MKQCIALLACLVATSAFAADQVVKEETTPPPAAEAITPEQLQPMVTGAKAITKPATPAPAPKKSAENDQQIYNMVQDTGPSSG